MTRCCWTESGELYGYPKCCIKDFVKRVNYNYNNPNNPILVKRIPKRISEGTGFIPCSYCSWKVLSKKCELKDLIKNRKCGLSFPRDYC